MPESISNLRLLTPEQKQVFIDNGYLIVEQLYSPDEIAEMRDRFHDLITRIEGRPENMNYAKMEPAEGYEIDPFNPENVSGMMDRGCPDCAEILRDDQADR